MATQTLTKGNPELEFDITAPGDVQVVIDQDSVFSGAVFKLLLETETPGTFMQVPDTSTSTPYSKIFTLRTGKIKGVLTTASESSAVVVDIRV